MITNYLSAVWNSVAVVVGNHLWQSTFFAAVAGSLAFILRKSQARVRCWLWLASSVKFLIPFSLLVTVGSHLTWPHVSGRANTGLYLTMEEVGQPFTPQARSLIFPKTSPAVFSNLVHLLPAIVAAVWLCGFVMVFFVWCTRWRRVCATMREAVPVCEGREIEILRRLERITGIRKPIEMFLSKKSFEPGVCGIRRPVLIWPEGISEHLEDAHLEAILAHELCHVRRRDNLAAATHMAVEAIFWFHPLVWWLGARLVEERELACDEEVLRTCEHSEVYAESILRVCEFCIGSPLACVSGVTGADLKKRIARIMTERVAPRLGFGRKLLLGVAGLVVVVAPLISGSLRATQARHESQAQKIPAAAPTFEVASIKTNKSANGRIRTGWFSPGEYSATGVTMQMLIREAYGIDNSQIVGAPGWLNSEKFDIEAKLDSSATAELHKLSFDQFMLESQRMLQGLLADRFKLTVHSETRELPVYALVFAKGGPKLQNANPDDTYPNGIKDMNGKGHGNVIRMGRGQIVGQGIPISNLVRMLSQQLGRIVVDKTGLTGKYDFTLQWTPDTDQGLTGRSVTDDTPPADSDLSLFTAIQEQLGLKLESQKGPVDVFVIDHVEEPSEN